MDTAYFLSFGLYRAILLINKSFIFPQLKEKIFSFDQFPLIYFEVFTESQSVYVLL